MDIWKKITGTINEYWRIGLNGFRLTNNSGIAEIRNASGGSLAIARAASPVGPNDVATKGYADNLEKPRFISDQADCSSSIPLNTAASRYIVVSTAGSGAVIGDVLFDNGLNDSAPMEILGKVDGRVIVVTTSLSGGTVTFDADSGYQWDNANLTWVKIFDVGGLTGAERVIRKVINNSATQDSTQKVPAGNRVTKSALIITTPYTAPATIKLGNSSTSDLFMLATDNNPQVASVTMFVVEQDTLVSSELAVRATVSDTPAAGAGIMYVWYASPNA